jgi:hypothetical protein
MAAGKRSTDLLFTQQDGKPWVKSAQQPRMRAALKAAGIHRHVRFHDLRHTFAMWQVAAGTSIQMVANQLGHASTRVAEEHYAHYSPSHIASTIRQAQSALGASGVRVAQGSPAAKDRGLRFKRYNCHSPGYIAAQVRRAKRKGFADPEEATINPLVCNMSHLRYLFPSASSPPWISFWALSA